MITRAKCIFVHLLFCFFSLHAISSSFAAGEENSAPASRLKDIGHFDGVRDNLLVGYGLVVGLNGTGDNLGQSPFTKETMTSMLERMGVNVRTNGRNSNIQARNLAAVMVTAVLPPFARQGSRIDVTVSSMGGAKSLRGGNLLVTPLLGADGEVYAVGQGPVSVGGYQAAGADGTTTTKGVPTNGSIPNGAIIEKEIPYNLEKLATVRFVLSNPDFTTAKRIADEINRNFGKISRALDSGTVRISIPDSYQAYPLMFISQVEQLKIIPDQMARIVIDEKNGVIIMGENVKIRKGAISHGELVVKIDESQNVSQPNPLTGGGNASNPTVTNPGGLTAMGPGGQTVVTPESKVNVREEKASIAMFDGPRLEDVVQAFRDLKVPQAEISSILQNMKKAGMIQADIEVR